MLSGLELTEIKRSTMTMEFNGTNDFEIRVSIVGESSKPTLLLCHDYMSAACIQWRNYIKPLSEHFRLVMPDMGTYGCNSRLSGGSMPSTQQGAEALMIEWFEKLIAVLGSQMPDKFSLMGFGNGAY